MASRKRVRPLTDAKGEVRELTLADMKQFKPAREVLPSNVLKKLGVRGPQKTPTKTLVSLRLSPEVLAHYKSTGPGWQTRIDQTLKRAVSRDRRG